MIPMIIDSKPVLRHQLSKIYECSEKCLVAKAVATVSKNCRDQVDTAYKHGTTPPPNQEYTVYLFWKIYPLRVCPETSLAC